MEVADNRPGSRFTRRTSSRTSKTRRTFFYRRSISELAADTPAGTAIPVPCSCWLPPGGTFPSGDPDVGATFVLYDDDCTKRTYSAGQVAIDLGQGHVHIGRGAANTKLTRSTWTFLRTRPRHRSATTSHRRRLPASDAILLPSGLGSSMSPAARLLAHGKPKRPALRRCNAELVHDERGRGRARASGRRLERAQPPRTGSGRHGRRSPPRRAGRARTARCACRIMSRSAAYAVAVRIESVRVVSHTRYGRRDAEPFDVGAVEIGWGRRERRRPRSSPRRRRPAGRKTFVSVPVLSKGGRGCRRETASRRPRRAPPPR
jgi:hypothetical protein